MPAFILEHVLQYPGSYEIPLRTMYTLNCIPRSQPRPRDLSRGQTPTGGSPVNGQMAWSDAEASSMSFTSQLMQHLRSVPQEQKSLPPSFIVNFVTRCFHPEIGLVDFNQGLTALDYLRDLETRRRKEMVAAFERVHIYADTYESDMQTMAEKFPGIALWVGNIEGKNRKAESHYALVWLGLRRWIMINELSVMPFNKTNCLGMLNTLFPPMQPHSKSPSPHINFQTLKEERDFFFNYIRLVQKNGPGVLQGVIDAHKKPDETTGWPTIQKTLEKYTRAAKQMIDECITTTGPEAFDRFSDESRKGKKTDSGVSFGSDRRPSVGPSLNEQPSPPSTGYGATPKNLSKIERITREFRRMRVKPRTEVEEIVHIEQRSAAPDHVPQPEGHSARRTLKKAKSLASLRFGNASSISLASRQGSDAVFDPAVMAKHRAMYEARTVQK